MRRSSAKLTRKTVHCRSVAPRYSRPSHPSLHLECPLNTLKHTHADSSFFLLGLSAPSFSKHTLTYTGWELEVKTFLANKKEDHVNQDIPSRCDPVLRGQGGEGMQPAAHRSEHTCEGQHVTARVGPGRQRGHHPPASLSFSLPSSGKDKSAVCQQRTARAVVFL